MQIEINIKHKIGEDNLINEGSFLQQYFKINKITKEDKGDTHIYHIDII